MSRLNASFVQSPHVPAADRLRFLRPYLQWALHGSEGWKAWWTAVAERTRAKVEKNARRNRPLA